MQWDLNEGRWTTILEDGLVAHASQVPEGWEVIIPARDMRELVRNRQLKTWLSARAIVERVSEAHLEWRDPHGDDPLGVEPPGAADSTERLQKQP